MRALFSPRILLTALIACFGWTAWAANIGPDDRQVSFTGALGTTASDAVSPAVAFDSVNQQYLAVWSADEIDGQFRIYAQFLSASAGAPIGSVMDLTPVTLPDRDQRQPVVAFSPDYEEFLVVWTSDTVDLGSYEILCRIVGSDGQIAPAVQQISSMGFDRTDPAYDAVTPDVAWHPVLDAYTVVWAGDDDLGDLTDGRFEIYGQLVAGGTGLQTGADDFRISFSLSGVVENDVLKPSVAIHPASDRWFVAFEGDVVSDPIHDPEIWMYGVTGDVPDNSAVNVAIMGANYADGLSGRNPDLAFVPSSGELVCVWDGDDGSGNSPAVYGQRLALDGSPIGTMFPISGGAGTGFGDLREATHPAIVVDPTSDEWFIAWQGDLNDGQIHFDQEVWARRFNDNGAPVDAAAFRLSEMDPMLTPGSGAGAPAVAVNAFHGYKLVVWSGDKITAAGEKEIYAQAWADDGASPVEETPAAAFALHGAAPNPFNPKTTIAFDLPRAESVTLRIYDASGRLVRTLLNGERGEMGRNEVVWNGRDDRDRQAASGVYLYRLEAGRQSQTDRMVLIK